MPCKPKPKPKPTKKERTLWTIIFLDMVAGPIKPAKRPGR